MKIRLVAWARRKVGADWENFVEGDIVEDDSPWSERLVRIGAAVQIDELETTESDEDAENADANDADESEDGPETTEPAADVKRPAKTAPVDTWRKYAESMGVEVKGLSKQEIIAATQ
ncbi:hypothetical protein A9D03_12600 [Corynebacterium striatum]|nr:hypothetical protein [Corynebacterium striatum]